MKFLKSFGVLMCISILFAFQSCTSSQRAQKADNVVAENGEFGVLSQQDTTDTRPVILKVGQNEELGMALQKSAQKSDACALSNTMQTGNTACDSSAVAAACAVQSAVHEHKSEEACKEAAKVCKQER